LAPYNTPSDPDNAAEVAATTAASVGLLNLRAALNLLADRLEIAAYCRNATDNRGKVVVEQLPSPLSVIIAERRDPRTVGVSATYKFGGT
jgi:iron complex outermembrane receptor protein